MYWLKSYECDKSQKYKGKLKKWSACIERRQVWSTMIRIFLEMLERVLTNFNRDTKKDVCVDRVYESQVLSFWGKLSILIEMGKAYGLLSSIKFLNTIINEVNEISDARNDWLDKKLWGSQNSKI